MLEKSEQRRIIWIKNKLPKSITGFRNIHSYELFLNGNNILVGVSFGEGKETCCYIKIEPKDIGWRE